MQVEQAVRIDRQKRDFDVVAQRVLAALGGAGTAPYQMTRLHPLQYLLVVRAYERPPNMMPLENLAHAEGLTREVVQKQPLQIVQRALELEQHRKSAVRRAVLEGRDSLIVG